MVRLFQRHGTDLQMVRRATTLLDALFSIAETGEYPLKPKQEIDRTKLAIAIYQFRQEQVQSIRFISLSQLGNLRWERNGDLFLFKDAQLRLLEEEVQMALGIPLGEAMFNTLSKHRTSQFTGTRFKTVWEGACFNIHVALMAVVIATVQKEENEFLRIAPYVRQISDAFPIAQEDGRPGTWSVLTAS